MFRVEITSGEPQPALRRFIERVIALPRWAWLVGLAVVAWMALLAVAVALWVFVPMLFNLVARPG